MIDLINGCSFRQSTASQERVGISLPTIPGHISLKADKIEAPKIKIPPGGERDGDRQESRCGPEERGRGRGRRGTSTRSSRTSRSPLLPRPVYRRSRIRSSTSRSPLLPPAPSTEVPDTLVDVPETTIDTPGIPEGETPTISTPTVSVPALDTPVPVSGDKLGSRDVR